MAGLTLAVAMAMLLPGELQASGLKLSWPSGLRDLHVESARVCTLYVSASPGDSLPSSPWRFIWIGTAAVDTPLVLLEGTGWGEVAVPTLFRGPRTVADNVGHITTAYFEREAGSVARTTAAYLMEVHPSLRARLVLAPMVTADGGWGVDTLDALTINGGSDVPLPPVLCSAVASADDAPVAMPPVNGALAGRATVLRLTGRRMGEIARAFALEESGRMIPATIVMCSDTAIVATPENAPQDPQCVFVIERSDGVADALPLSLMPDGWVSSTYHYDQRVDSALVHHPATIGFASHPLDDSWALQYQALRSPEFVNSLYSFSGGVWSGEALPPAMPQPSRGGLAIGEDGTIHLVGMSGASLTHWWRPCTGGQWQSEVLWDLAAPGVMVIQWNVVRHRLELVYSASDYGYSRLLWTCRTDGHWSDPVQIEDGWGQVTSFAFSVDAEGAAHVAYSYLADSSSGPEFLWYATHSSDLGLWDKSQLWLPMFHPWSLSMIHDPVAESVVITCVDWFESGVDALYFFYRDPLLGEWFVEPPSYWPDLSVWDASMLLSSNGVTHIAAVVGPGNMPFPDEENGPVRVYHYQRTATGAGGFRPWTTDTVAAPELALAPGPAVMPIGLGLSGDTPLIAFGCAPDVGRLYVASMEAVAAVPPAPAGAAMVRGPWPNPASRQSGMSFALGAQQSKTYDCELFDVRGGRMRKESHEVQPGAGVLVRWSTTGMRAGLYFVRVRASSGEGVVRKIAIIP